MSQTQQYFATETFTGQSRVFYIQDTTTSAYPVPSSTIPSGSTVTQSFVLTAGDTYSLVASEAAEGTVNNVANTVSNSGSFDFDVSAAPEPASVTLFGLGASALLCRRRPRRG